MGLKTFGLMGVDWEERVNLERLRQDRLNRIKAALKKSEMGALLCFDMNNVRYITATHIGPWAMDKLVLFSLLPQDDEPIMWDFGSAARHHQIYCPWLRERFRAGLSTLRRATTPAPRPPPGLRPRRRCGEKNQSRTGQTQIAQRTRRSRRDRASCALCAASSGHQSRRRPAAHARGEKDQNPG